MQNFVQEGKHINVACSHPTTPASGDPVRIGEFCGVAITKEGEGDNAATETTVLTKGVVSVSVKAINGSGNSAVAVGDKIYYTDADTPVLAKKSTGRLFGYALGAITSGSTATINVLLAN
jgi:predicted RecA/RadA family phage recombinase